MDFRSLPICDDCGEEYEGPVYYSLDMGVTHLNSLTLAVEEGCTGNLCPECAGPFLDPDDPDDPRRPKELVGG
jgi:hypothetical protein